MVFAAMFAGAYEVFYGTASPPTSYGGYGGNAKEDAKYTFEYPAGWKPAAPNKVEKGTQGIDCRVFNVSANKWPSTSATMSRIPPWLVACTTRRQKNISNSIYYAMDINCVSRRRTKAHIVVVYV